jgi:flagellar basal body rod protein FlgG
MVAKQTEIDVIAHNLANVNTTGFKKAGMIGTLVVE